MVKGGEGRKKKKKPLYTVSCSRPGLLLAESRTLLLGFFSLERLNLAVSGWRQPAWKCPCVFPSPDPAQRARLPRGRRAACPAARVYLPRRV